jgi:prepilin-type N-terminal cleavage/methylation domain-containing protein
VSNSGGATPAGGFGAGLPAGTSTGFTLMELTIVLAIVSLAAAMTAPVLAGAGDAGRAREAAQFVAAQCRGARMEAIARNATSSLVFDLVSARWKFRRCVDGNGNGMRRADITSGRDVCQASTDVANVFLGVRVEVPAGLPDPDGGAPTTGAVRFGSSDIASFSPLGTASAGTVYLRSDGGAQYAIRVAGPTGRVRVLKYSPALNSWSEI